MATKLGFSIESSLASKHLTDADYIKGGYFIVDKFSDLAGYKVATADQDGTIVDGSKCFCREDRIHYRYDGTVSEWVEDTTDIKLSGTVVRPIGGIGAHTTYTNKSVAEILNDLLFPYVAPSTPTLSIYTETGEQILSTYSTERTITVKKAKISFTAGSEPIKSVKIGTTSGGNDLYEGVPETFDDFITFAEGKSVTYENGTGGTIYCTISDGTTDKTDSFSVSFPYTAPSGLAFSIYTETGEEFSGMRTFGDKTPATKAKISFTAGSKPITSVKIGNAKGGNGFYDGLPDTSGMFDLTTNITFTGENAQTIYCRISDGTNGGYTDAELTVDFDYIAPSVVFKIYNAEDKEVSGTIMYGKEHSIGNAKITITEGSKPITSVKIGTTEGGDDLYSATSIPSDGVVTFKNDQKVYLNGADDTTIYCSVSDDRTNVPRSVTVSYAQYCFVAVTKTDSPPQYMTEIKSVIGQSYTTKKEITNEENTYVWLLVPQSQITGDMVIKQDEVSVYTHRKEVDKFYAVGNVPPTAYYAYRTELLPTATTATYVLDTFVDDNNYVVVTSNTNTPESVDEESSIGEATEATITPSLDSYVWFLMTDNTKPHIHIQSFGDKWYYVGTTNVGEVTLTTELGVEIKRYAYRTTEDCSDVTAKFCMLETMQNAG